MDQVIRRIIVKNAILTLFGSISSLFVFGCFSFGFVLFCKRKAFFRLLDIFTLFGLFLLFLSLFFALFDLFLTLFSI